MSEKVGHGRKPTFSWQTTVKSSETNVKTPENAKPPKPCKIKSMVENYNRH